MTSSFVAEIMIKVWRNVEEEDWSVEINGLRHDHVPSETLEALVECAIIAAETLIQTETQLTQ